MEFEQLLKDKLDDYLHEWASDMKSAIEYEFSVEYGEINLGEPYFDDNSISFDLSNLSDYEKELLENFYYDNAKKRKQKGGA